MEDSKQPSTPADCIGVALVLILLLATGFMSTNGPMLGAATGHEVTDRKLNFERIASLQGELKPDSKLAGASEINIDAMLGALAALQSYGAKVELSDTSKAGISFMRIKVDGKDIGSIPYRCIDCDVIVYEY